jgi:hypothetical protein
MTQGGTFGFTNNEHPERLRLVCFRLSRTTTSRTSEEIQIESREQQDNANIYDQPFPESIPQEHEIHADDDGYHRRHVKRYNYRSTHFSWPSQSRRHIILFANGT